MPSFLSFVTLALAATSVFATTPTPVKRDGQSLNPDVASIQVDLNVVVGRSLPDTNARRFAAGLSPAKPRRSHRKMARDPAPSGTPVGTKTGYLKVTDATTGASLGYLSSALNVFGEYGLFTTDKVAALSISFDSSASTFRDLLASNSLVSSLPYLGATVGFSSSSDKLAASSPDYLFLTANEKTDANQPPAGHPNSFSTATGISKSAASAIWTYDSVTNAFTPQWVNPDNSLPTTIPVYVASEQAIALVGDYDSFNGHYSVTAQKLAFTFESA